MKRLIEQLRMQLRMLAVVKLLAWTITIAPKSPEGLLVVQHVHALLRHMIERPGQRAVYDFPAIPSSRIG